MEAMTKANAIIRQLREINDYYKEEKRKLFELQKQLDREVSRIYHDLESRGNLNAAEGYCVARDLQLALRKRRLVKQELYEMKVIDRPIQIDQLSNKLEKAEKSMNKVKRNRNRKDNYMSSWNLNVSDFENEYIN